ncbi:MAG: hypothetical protein H6584_06790 [Flavobacteriales bacterium]|nr:hypothetical protein [Flavobacteriales bacterium]
MERQCPECGDSIVGRIDKKFCSDQCRASHNNKQNVDSRKYVREVNTILKKNRRILSDLNTTGKTKVHREQLVVKGFNFQYLTNTYTTQKGVVYYFCYEHGYLPVDDDYFYLVIKQGYVG